MWLRTLHEVHLLWVRDSSDKGSTRVYRGASGSRRHIYRGYQRSGELFSLRWRLALNVKIKEGRSKHAALCKRRARCGRSELMSFRDIQPRVDADIPTLPGRVTSLQGQNSHCKANLGNGEFAGFAPR